MQKRKTFFEQVPLEIVKKIVGENGGLNKAVKNTSSPRKEKLEKELIETSTTAVRLVKS
jgi:hypothetical protein